MTAMTSAAMAIVRVFMQVNFPLPQPIMQQHR